MSYKSSFIALFTVSLLAGSPLAEAEEPVLIGVVQPLTGQAGPSGHTILKGIQLAAEEINEGGGILDGRQIELIPEDGKCIPSESVSAAKKLIHQDKVAAVIGALCSSSTLAVQKITRETKTVHLNAASISPELTAPDNRHKYYFRVAHNSAEFAKGFADFIMEHIKPKTMAYFAVNDDYGRSEVAALSARFEAINGATTAFKGYFEYRDNDFTSVLARIRSANPDGLYLVARLPQNVKILKQMQSIGYRPKFLAGSVDFSQQEAFENAGEAIEGVYFPTPYFPNDTKPGAQEFQNAYQEKFNTIPLDLTASLGWTALYTAARGIEEAGTDTDSEKIAAAIQSLEWDGPYGRVSFDENGQNRIDVRIGQIVDGQPVEVE